MKIKMKYIKYLSILVIDAYFLISLVSCVSFLSGQSRSLTIDTPIASGATCQLTDNKGKFWKLSDTPETVVIRKDQAPMTIACENRGEEERFSTKADTYSIFFAPYVTINEEYQKVCILNCEKKVLGFINYNKNELWSVWNKKVLTHELKHIAMGKFDESTILQEYFE